MKLFLIFLAAFAFIAIVKAQEETSGGVSHSSPEVAIAPRGPLGNIISLFSNILRRQVVDIIQNNNFGHNIYNPRESESTSGDAGDASSTTEAADSDEQILVTTSAPCNN